jgi:galactosamine-6-phosphate isomerase
MKLVIEKDYESMSARTADEIINTIRNKPEAVLCLAAGDTPRKAYTLVSHRVKEEQIDVTRCTFVSLDEWVGIPPENEGSCQYFLRATLFSPMNIKDTQVHLFDGLSNDLENECKQMDDFLSQRGGIDLMVVGVGRNGHIGFNEPGVDPEQLSHVVELDDTTKTVGQKYFQQATTLNQGITLGLQHLLNSKQAILIANGKGKAGVIREALEAELNPSMPAGYIRLHNEALVILDEEAASLLNAKQPSQ